MQVSELVQNPPLGNSYHNVITFKFNCYLDYSKPKDVYAYTKGNYEAMRNHLDNCEWAREYTELAKEKTVEEMWELMKTKLLYLRNQFIPRQTISGKPSWKDQGTYPISKMHRQWMSARRHGEADFARHLYNKARNKLKSMLRRDKRLFEKRIATESKSNPKAFWSHTRRKLKTKSGVAPLFENEKDNSSLKFDD